MIAARSGQNATGAERTPATFAPTAGLGAALATLPPPWTVFWQGGLSPFDYGRGEIYGGVYIALHPERGVALVDVEPAQPGKALPRLRGLLRETGLPEFAGEAPPVIALVLTRGDISLVGLRLGKAFEGGPILKSPSWTKVAAAALTARFPDLKQVLRSGGIASASELADADTAAATAPPIAPAAAAASTPAFVASAPPPRLTSGESSSAGDTPRHRYSRPSMESVEAEERDWLDWLPRGRLIQAVIAAAIVVAAALWFLPLRHAATPGSGPTSPAPSAASVDVTPPPQQPLQLPAVPPAAAPPPQAATVVPPASAPLPGAVPAPAAPPLGQAGGAPAATASAPPAVVPAAPSVPPPAQTAIVTPPPPVTPPAVQPPSALSKAAVPPPGKVVQPTVAPARKAPKAETSQTATREERPRKREADQPVVNPEDTVTVDGVTYVKGREPHTLGAAAVPPESGDTGQTTDRAPPQDAAPAPAQDAAPAAAQDHTPGSITLAPSSAAPVQEPAGTTQDLPQ